MRPAVVVFAPLLLLPYLACESDLAGPEPDAAVTELQQPPSTQPLFDEGPNGPGCSVIADGCGATERNGNGPNDAGPTAADASTADTEKQQAAGTRKRKGMQEADAEPLFNQDGVPDHDQHKVQEQKRDSTCAEDPEAATATDASTADTDAVAESEGIPTKKKVQARKGKVSTDAVTEGEGDATQKKKQTTKKVRAKKQN